jgi:hypothetical protein
VNEIAIGSGRRKVSDDDESGIENENVGGSGVLEPVKVL